MLIEKGIKPNEIVKILNSSNPTYSNKQYDFSEDSDEEVEEKENKIIKEMQGKKAESQAKSLKINNNDSDTESDSEMELIKDVLEDERIISEDSLETLNRVKKFINKNRVQYQHSNMKGENILENSTDRDQICSKNKGVSINKSNGNSLSKEFINKKRKLEE
jgi:hypothetical protein